MVIKGSKAVKERKREWKGNYKEKNHNKADYIKFYIQDKTN